MVDEAYHEETDWWHEHFLEYSGDQYHHVRCRQCFQKDICMLELDDEKDFLHDSVMRPRRSCFDLEEAGKPPPTSVLTSGNWEFIVLKSGATPAMMDYCIAPASP
jgi:hypothetical protein